MQRLLDLPTRGFAFAALSVLLSAGIPYQADAAPVATHEMHRIVCGGNGLCYYHGNNFALGTLTLGQLSSYCAGVTDNALSWHLGSANEVGQLTVFLAHDTGLWHDFSQVVLNSPGYILVTATAQMTSSYTSDSHAFAVDVYRLYGSANFPALNEIDLGATNIIGASVDSAPLTDGGGNAATVKVVCVASKR